MAEITTLVVGPLEVNCYIFWDGKSKEAFVIDPGGDLDDILGELKANGLTVKYIINTHGHFDHVGADNSLKEACKAKVAIHGSDVALLKDAHEHATFFGVNTPKQAEPDILLEDGSVIESNGLKLRVIHTPGHSKGGICLYSEADKALFTGDTLFAGSVGRTDFEGGSYEELMTSIKKKILPLGDDVVVLPGHGGSSTIAEEKGSNPFLTGLK